MPSRSHIARLADGHESWNEWREAHPLVDPNFRKGRLAEYDLAHYNLRHADFTDADLTGAMLFRADLQNAILRSARLQRANLRMTDMSGAIVEDTNFTGARVDDAILHNLLIERSVFDDAVLSGSTLKYMALFNVSMRRARLRHVIFHDAQLADVDLTSSIMGNTVLVGTSLLRVKGLETVQHTSPSSVGIDTFFLEGGLPEAFLRGAGVPEEFVTYAAALVGAAIEYYSVFISYSSRDELFARRLYADLQARNIRAWFAPEDLKIGDRLRSAIDQSIRARDKLVLVLSGSALTSSWVEKEVETAFARERKERRDVLFPIRLDDAVFDTDQAWAADIVNTRHIGDFSSWQVEASYSAALQRLVRDLKRHGATEMNGGAG